MVIDTLKEKGSKEDMVQKGIFTDYIYKLKHPFESEGKADSKTKRDEAEIKR